jgi:hypothetical protein
MVSLLDEQFPGAMKHGKRLLLLGLSPLVCLDAADDCVTLQ